MPSAASDLTAASWQAFSRLLDEALERPAGERLAWLEALGAEHEALKPALHAVLLRSNGVDTAQWLATLPHTAGAAALADEDDLKPEARVGPYRLLRELGVGGMGAVWLAERADGTLKRRVALKLPRASWSRGLAERMARERDILASLEHPHIARLYDAGTDAQGRPFLALEYVEGQPIDVYCRERSLALRGRVDLLLQVAHAVAFAHSRLVVHRDLKPSNILVTADGQVRLLDFGIAKLMEGDRTQETQLTQLAGRALTLDYASPEQIRGEPLGTASDVYSLGVVAYELLAGAKPYKLKRGSAAELEEAIAAVDAPLASTTATDAQTKKALKGDLDAILNKALKKNAAERYATVDALAQDVERYLAGQRVVARPDSIAYRLSRFARRYRTPLAAAAITLAAFGLALGVGATALVILALLLGLGAALWQTRRARAERDRARSEQIRAEQMREFLMQMLSETEPWPGRENEPISALDMLDRGVDRAAQVYARDPRAQADILVKLANVYQRLSHTPRSVRPLQQAIRLLEAQGRPADPTLNEAKAYLANDFLISGDEQAARSIWRKVLADCDGNDEQSWQVRGYAHYSLSWDPDLDVARAREHVEQALHAYSLGFGAINEAAYQPLERLAQLAVEAGDVTAAESALDRMDVLARHIPQKTLELERAETVRAEVDGAKGRYRVAHERLARLLAAPNASRPAYLVSSALIQQSSLSCSQGLPERGLAEALRAFAESPGAAPSRRHLKARLAEAIALALLARHEEARAALDDANMQARSLKLGEGNSAVLALRRSSVRLLAMRGECPAAGREAQALLTDIVRIHGKSHVEYLPTRLLQAIAFLALGDSAAAAVGAEEVLAMARALANPAPPVAVRAGLLRALASAPAGVGVQAVHAAARRLETFIDPSSPLLPRVRALPASASNDERADILLAFV